MIDYSRLVEEIDKLRPVVPPEKLAIAVRDLISELGEKNNGIVLVSKSFGPYLIERYMHDVANVLHQLLFNSWRSCTYGIERSAQALYHFLGPFCVHRVTGYALNEFGFENATILDPTGVRRLAVLYSHLDKTALHPFSVMYTGKDPSGNQYRYLKSFEEFSTIVEMFGMLVNEAAELNKGLYLFIE